MCYFDRAFPSATALAPTGEPLDIVLAAEAIDAVVRDRLATAGEQVKRLLDAPPDGDQVIRAGY